MNKIISFILLVLVFFSFSGYAEAHNSRSTNRDNFRDIVTSVHSAKDTNSLYILGDTSIAKYSLPDLMLVLSVDLPNGSVGRGIDIVSGCNQNSTVLVSVKLNGGESILSYNQDLQLIASLQTKTVSNDIHDEENDGDNNNESEDHGNSSSGG